MPPKVTYQGTSEDHKGATCHVFKVEDGGTYPFGVNALEALTATPELINPIATHALCALRRLNGLPREVDVMHLAGLILEEVEKVACPSG